MFFYCFLVDPRRTISLAGKPYIRSGMVPVVLKYLVCNRNNSFKNVKQVDTSHKHDV